MTDESYEKFKFIHTEPNSVDPIDGNKVRIELSRPPDSLQNPLGADSAQFEKLILAGDNVLDFVRHYQDATDGRFYFRGEPLYSTELIPSLLRSHNLPRLVRAWNEPDPVALEKALLNRFKRYTWHTFHAESDFAGQQLNTIESLCVAQHNGLPTMLLDWSLNPFIALFFAARYQTRFIGREREKLNAATVWVMKLCPPNDREKMTIHLEEQKGNSDVDGLVSTHGEYSPLVVVPLSFTRRIDAQSGRFLYCSCLAKNQTSYDLDEVNLHPTSLKDWHKKPWVKIDQWIIPGEQRDEVLKQIRILGFHDGKMFPDLKGWANYLQAGHK